MFGKASEIESFVKPDTAGEIYLNIRYTIKYKE